MRSSAPSIGDDVYSMKMYYTYFLKKVKYKVDNYICGLVFLYGFLVLEPHKNMVLSRSSYGKVDGLDDTPIFKDVTLINEPFFHDSSIDFG